MSGPLFERLAVIGCGLIGSSIVRAAREARVVGAITVGDLNPAVVQRVQELGLADHVTENRGLAMTGAYLLSLAAPGLALGPALSRAAARLHPRPVVRGVGWVKGAAAVAMSGRVRNDVFVGPGDPIPPT